MESEDSPPKRQFKLAEMADAMMGSVAPTAPSDIESLFPQNVRDQQAGFSPPSEESGAQCDPSGAEDVSGEPSQQVTRQQKVNARFIFHFY